LPVCQASGAMGEGADFAYSSVMHRVMALSALTEALILRFKVSYFAKRKSWRVFFVM
jgi:hypothetical protein